MYVYFKRYTLTLEIEGRRPRVAVLLVLWLIIQNPPSRKVWVSIFWWNEMEERGLSAMKITPIPAYAPHHISQQTFPVLACKPPPFYFSLFLFPTILCIALIVHARWDRIWDAKNFHKKWISDSELSDSKTFRSRICQCSLGIHILLIAPLQRRCFWSMFGYAWSVMVSSIRSGSFGWVTNNIIIIKISDRRGKTEKIMQAYILFHEGEISQTLCR